MDFFKRNRKLKEKYLVDTVSSEHFLDDLVSVCKWGWELACSFAKGNINDDNSGSALDEDTIHEDPPKRDCKFPSRSSFLNKDSVE